MTISEDLKHEAKAFDDRILERVRNGMVPDLRRAQPSDYFYNNPWRRPRYVEMVFGQYLGFARKHLPSSKCRLLEVGCGPGHMALELARDGHHVTGIEVSGASIEVARRTLAENPYKDGFGALEYIHDDFLSWETDARFDAVAFFLTFHHFDAPGRVVSRVADLLSPGGTIIVIEPARDWFSPLNAAVGALIRILLSEGKSWYAPISTPVTPESFARYATEVLDEYREARDRGEAEQSPHDNSCAADQMLQVLEPRFRTLALQPAQALVPRMVGGVRGSDEEQTARIAECIWAFDEYCVARGLLQPGAFCYAGTLK